MNIVFFGTPHYSLLVLEKLFNAGFNIVCVVTKPDQFAGRKKILTPTPVKIWALEYNIPVLTPTSSKTKPWEYDDINGLIKEILKYKPEVLITADYSQKIPQELITKVKYALNVHPSLLPKYRGPAPVPWAILNGEKETGVSIVTLSDKFDSGKIIAQTKEPILDTDTTDSLLIKLFNKGADLLINVLNQKSLTSFWQARNERVQNQTSDPGQARMTPLRIISTSYYPRLTREHSFETWENIQKAMTTGENAKRIERKFRAFHPWPGLWTMVKLSVVNGKLLVEKNFRLKILKLNLQPTTNNLQLNEVQLEGKQPISGKDVENLIRQFRQL